MRYPARTDVSRTRHARSALRHFERALAVWKPETEPYYYALAQYNRGCVYLQLAASPEDMGSALACFLDAFECGRSSGNTEIQRLAGPKITLLLCRDKPQIETQSATLALNRPPRDEL